VSKSSQENYGSIYPAIKRAEEAELKYKWGAQFLAEIDREIKERERTSKTHVLFRGSHERMCRMAETSQRRLVKLEAKKRNLVEKCLASFVGHPVVRDLIHERDMDIPHQWQSIPDLRKELNKPSNTPDRRDKWERRVLASYSDEQIEQELLESCQYCIEGTRQRDGVTEYLLP
jgi:hypothetical protein